eukprot:1176693-Prorocentrum_minimum.AAC.2
MGAKRWKSKGAQLPQPDEDVIGSWTCGLLGGIEPTVASRFVEGVDRAIREAEPTPKLMCTLTLDVASDLPSYRSAMAIRKTLSTTTLVLMSNYSLSSSRDERFATTRRLGVYSDHFKGSSTISG